MSLISISLAGILKMLADRDQTKAAGPATIKPIVLKPLCVKLFFKIHSTPFKSLLTEKGTSYAFVYFYDKYGPLKYRPFSMTCICCTHINGTCRSIKPRKTSQQPWYFCTTCDTDLRKEGPAYYNTAYRWAYRKLLFRSSNRSDPLGFQSGFCQSQSH